MSQLASWSYTAIATVWHRTGRDPAGDQIFSGPIKIKCDYILGGSSKIVGGTSSNSVGVNFVIKNTFYTEYALIKEGDFILIGDHEENDPIKINAEKVRKIIQYADTFYRLADDFEIITAV